MEYILVRLSPFRKPCSPSDSTSVRRKGVICSCFRVSLLLPSREHISANSSPAVSPAVRLKASVPLEISWMRMISSVSVFWREKRIFTSSSSSRIISVPSPSRTVPGINEYRYSRVSPSGLSARPDTAGNTSIHTKSRHSHFLTTDIHLLVCRHLTLQVADQFLPHPVHPRVAQAEIHLPVGPRAA